MTEREGERERSLLASKESAKRKNNSTKYTKYVYFYRPTNKLERRQHAKA